MHYQDWQTKHLPRVDKFVKFVLECLREADKPDRNGRPMLIHDELVTTYIHEHNMSLSSSIHSSIHILIYLSLSLSLTPHPSMYSSIHQFSINVDE